MRKIDWETAFTNNTFFFEDENIEACFENDINIRVNEIADKITTLRDADGIKSRWYKKVYKGGKR